jgi:hypothetical protein
MHSRSIDINGIVYILNFNDKIATSHADPIESQNLEFKDKSLDAMTTARNNLSKSVMPMSFFKLGKSSSESCHFLQETQCLIKTTPFPLQRFI